MCKFIELFVDFDIKLVDVMWRELFFEFDWVCVFVVFCVVMLILVRWVFCVGWFWIDYSLEY